MQGNRINNNVRILLHVDDDKKHTQSENSSNSLGANKNILGRKRVILTPLSINCDTVFFSLGKKYSKGRAFILFLVLSYKYFFMSTFC